MSVTTMGVYAIQNLVTGRAYIGGSIDISTRWREHRLWLSRGYHVNGGLMRDAKRYGADAFSLVVLEIVESERDLVAAEQRWLDTIDHDTLYNIDPHVRPRKPSGPNRGPLTPIRRST